MIKTIQIAICFLLIGYSNLTGQNNHQIEELAIKKVVDSLYNSLSFEEGERPDTAQFLSIFLKDGIMINNNRQQPRVLSPAQFAKGISGIKGLAFFTEQEIWGETRFFGNIAQRYSVYEKHLQVEDKEATKGKGVNSFQLVKVNGRWMVNSVIWTDETEEMKVPDK